MKTHIQISYKAGKSKGKGYTTRQHRDIHSFKEMLQEL